MNEDIGVYIIKCTVTGERYVGHSTYSINGRLSTHFSTLKSKTHSNRNLQKLYNEHGRSAFVFTKNICTEGESLKEEQRLIDYWSSRGLCLNVQPNAVSAVGSKFTEEQKEVQSAAAKERCTEKWRNDVSKRVKEQHAEGKFGRATWSDEVKKIVAEKISKALKGKPHPRPEGWVCSEESRERYRQAAIKREAAKKLKGGVE